MLYNPILSSAIQIQNKCIDSSRKILRQLHENLFVFVYSDLILKVIQSPL